MKNMVPILLFTYKRLDALKKTIEALSANELADQSDLYIFSDGPKTEKDAGAIQKVRAYLKTVEGFKNINIKASEGNKGLAKSIISGVSEVMKLSDKVIVMEDDLLTTSNFLTFMNNALTKYENEEKVFSVSGYSMNLNQDDNNTSETYFLNRGWSWGWATWKSRWNDVDWEMKDYESFKNNKRKKSEFAMGGSDLNKMLRNQMEGSLDSWAIRWFYHQFKVSGLTLYPVYSKVYNNGFDQLATHTTGSNNRYLPLLDKDLNTDVSYPKNIEISQNYQKAFLKNMGVKARIRSKVETIFQSKFSAK